MTSRSIDPRSANRRAPTQADRVAGKSARPSPRSLPAARSCREPSHLPRPGTAAQVPASCRNGIWPISIPASMRPKSRATSHRMDAECVAFETDYKGKLAEQTAQADGGDWLAEAVQALRGDRRSRRPSRLLCRPGPCRRQRRPGDLQILRRRLRAADRGLGASVVLRARAQPHRRCRDRTRDADAGAGALPAVDRGSAQGQALSARGSRRAAVPREIAERLCRLEPAVRPDHLGAALQGRRPRAGDRADAEPAAGPRRRPSARRRRRRWRRPSRPTSAPSR